MIEGCWEKNECNSMVEIMSEMWMVSLRRSGGDMNLLVVRGHAKRSGEEGYNDEQHWKRDECGERHTPTCTKGMQEEYRE